MYENLNLFFYAPSGHIEDRGLMPLIDMQEKIGGWPMVKGDEWDKLEWIWQCAVKALRQLGFSTDYLIDFSVETDLKNSTRRIIDVRLIN